MSDNLRAALEAKHRQHVHAGKCHGRLAAPKYERMEYLTGPGTYCEGCHNDWPCDTALALATEAEAAHPEPVDGLDVERLARALVEWWDTTHQIGDPGIGDGIGDAEIIAAEYARLSEKEGTPDNAAPTGLLRKTLIDVARWVALTDEPGAADVVASIEYALARDEGTPE